MTHPFQRATKAAMHAARHRPVWLAGLVVTAALTVGCDNIEPPLLPALPASANPSYAPGQIVWTDLLTADLARAEAFYGPLFGWTFEPTADPDYHMVRAGGSPVAGLIERDQEDAGEALWLVYLSVPDVSRASRAAAGRMGRILMKVQNAPDRGHVSLITDGEDAPLVLLRSANGDPERTAVPVGGILWYDLWTHDPTESARFYHDVAGLETKTIETRDGATETLLGRDGRVTGGLVKLPWKDVGANWLPYVRVDDVADTARRAARLGGRVLAQTEDVAIVQDPEGGAIGIQSRPHGGTPQ